RVATSPFERAAEPPLELFAESLRAPFLDEERQPDSVPLTPRSMVAKQDDDFPAELSGVIRRDEYIERRRDAEAARPHLSADEHIEAVTLRTIGGLHRRNQRQVLRFSVGAVLGTAADANVELSRQVREGLVAHEHTCELV